MESLGRGDVHRSPKQSLSGLWVTIVQRACQLVFSRPRSRGGVAEAAFSRTKACSRPTAGTLLRWRNASECTQSGRGPYTIARKLGLGVAGDPETLA